MQLNDYKINRKLLKFTNNINFIGKNKYLSRESSANKMEQSIYKSLSSSQLLTKSHRDNSHVKSKIQEISTIGSIYSKDSAYFNSLSNEQLNIPPIRSLNKDDGDKLIANLNKQIKQQNLLISKLKQQIITQSTDLDNMSQINEQFLEKQQSYEEITQSYHSSNQKILQLAQIREIQPYTNNYLEIVTQIYTDDYQLQVATQWRNQKLKLNFIRKWLTATKSLILINKFAKKLEKNRLQQYYYQWKRFLILKSSLLEFNQVKELRIKILHWKQWKNYILTKKQYDKNRIQAIQFYTKKVLFKHFQRLKQLYLQNNYYLTVFQNLQQQAGQQLGLLRQFQCFSKWKQQILNRKLIQSKLTKYLKQKQVITRQNVFGFLQINMKYYQQRNQIIMHDRIKNKQQKIFVQIKEYYHGIRFKEDQIKLNRPYFMKYHFWKRWSHQYNTQVQLMIKEEKIKEKRYFNLIQKLFNVLKGKAIYKKIQKQNSDLISQQYNRRIINQSLKIWLSNLLKQKILLDQEQSCCISQLIVIDQQQSVEVIELSQNYQSKLEQLKMYEEEVNNFQMIQANQNQIQKELQMQQYIFIIYFVIKCNKNELQILREQNKLIEEQIQQFKQQNFYPIEICNQEQEKLKLQLEANNSIFNQQQEKYIALQKEYSQIVIDYEKRIRNLENHYLEQSKQQRIQIQNILKGNPDFEIQLSRRQSSQPEQVSENKLSNINRQNFNTQNSPKKDILNQQIIQDDTTVNLREDIKKRLAYLKFQMDQQN
ncbi:unnamed protein product [Paramecium octaurelia]|uniref:Uncharacterized protein n=1 Tax=Paramecium octaurelia TaxID=43137 RepID=A0A8S1UJ74_PAROT|nr:unnamed protein product [Paramecium octaurelia]